MHMRVSFVKLVFETYMYHLMDLLSIHGITFQQYIYTYVTTHLFSDVKIILSPSIQIFHVTYFDTLGV